MKFSTLQFARCGLANLLLFWCVVSVFSHVTEASNSPSTTSSPTLATASIDSKDNLGDGGGDKTSGAGNVIIATQNNVTQSLSSKNMTNTSTAASTNSSRNVDYDVIPGWILKNAKTRLFSSTSPPPLIARARNTKLLEKPLESQLISQLDKSRDQLSSSSSVISSEKRHRLLRVKQGKTTTAASAAIVPTANPNTLNDARRREDTNTPQISLVEGGSANEVGFTSPVSPLEGSLGGLTGLQDLPPLSFVQFIKLLVAVTPFIIPLIFIPLLIFTIGLLMIPVTRGNVFVDIGDLRSPSSPAYYSSSMVPSFISSYLVNPLKSWSGSDALVALPRAFAYDLGTKLLDTEQCVERISCEISARYLHSHWEHGNWRSVANSGWISRILSYLWRSHPTVSRIAKSLQARVGDEQEKMRMTTEQDDSSSKSSNTTNRYFNGSYLVKSSNESKYNNSKESPRAFLCSRYTCQPKTFLKKLFSSQQSAASSAK